MFPSRMGARARGAFPNATSSLRRRQIQDLTSPLALLLALVVTAAGLGWASRSATFSDSYGYVSQADLWLARRLLTPQNFAADLDIPMARWGFSPLGYRPEAGGYGIVPTYPPGLPLLMAGAKRVAGHRAVFWIVPMCAGLLVFATYVLGRRMHRPVLGLVAAWLVATSPTTLFMMMAPMSDVPAAALWTLALVLALGRTRAGAAGAGLVAALAILVRPNLTPLAGIIVGWIAIDDIGASGTPGRGSWRRLWRGRAVLFAIASAIGAVANGVLNDRLFGSAGRSGYGPLSDLFAWSHALPNLQRYTSWLLSTETPLAAIGLAALLLASGRLWPTPEARRMHWLLAAIAAAVWVPYLFYTEFDAWWYLRFMLPAWPAMAIGTAAAIAQLYRQRRRWVRVAAVALVLAAGVRGVFDAHSRGAFSVARADARVPFVARTIRDITDRDAVIVSHLHSGTIRYYGGRMTFRWDSIDGESLDRAIDWMAARGHHPYLLLERSEIARLRGRFGAVSATARLDWPPAVSFFGGDVVLYDALRRDRDRPVAEVAEPHAFDRLPLPVSPPVW